MRITLILAVREYYLVSDINSSAYNISHESYFELKQF